MDDKSVKLAKMRKIPAIIKVISVVALFVVSGAAVAIKQTFPEKNYYYYLTLVFILIAYNSLAVVLGFDFKLQRYIESLEDDSESEP